MSGSFCLICVSLIVSTVVPFTWCQTREPEADDSRERPVVPGGSEVEKLTTEDPRARLKGLCRDGWSPGTMRDFSGKEIPICLKINPEALTWSEAQRSCRKDYGFLMKLDSRATVDEKDLLTSVLVHGITKFWTGMHSESGHLIWDDLIPNQVRPHNRVFNDSSFPERPWRWEASIPERRQQYCGQMNVETDDDRRRRKRSSDDDSTDNIFPAFDLSNFRNTMFNDNFRRSNNAFPPTSSFQSKLTRTRMSDQLELPGTLGLQSEHQIPGSGLLEANIQNGGLATNIPTFEPSANFEQAESETATPFGDLNSGDVLNTDSNENPATNPEDLLSAVKEIAANINSNLGDLPTPSPTEAAETLISLIQDNSDSFNTENGETGITDASESFGSETTLIPPTTVMAGKTNEPNVVNSDDASPADKTELAGLDIASVLADEAVGDSSNTGATETKATDVVSLLATDTSDDMKVLDDVNTKQDDQMSNGINAGSFNIDIADETAPLGNIIGNVTSPDFVAATALGPLDEISNSMSNGFADDLKNADDTLGSTDGVISDDSLGYGQLTDLLTNAAVNEALNIDNLNENKDTTEEIIDALGGNQETLLQTKSDENTPDLLTTLQDTTDSTDIENVNHLDVLTNLNENVDDVFEHKGDNSGLFDDVVSTAENILSMGDSKDPSEDSKLRFELDNHEDGNEILEQNLPDIGSASDTATSDSLDLNDIITDVNQAELPQNSIATDTEDLVESVKENENPSESFHELVDKATDVRDELDISKHDEGLEITDNIKSSIEDLTELFDNVPGVIENQNAATDMEQNEHHEDDQSDLDGDGVFDDIVTDNSDTQELNTAPQLDKEPVNTEFFEDMIERLGLPGETQNLESADANHDHDINDDPLETFKDLSEKTNDQELIDDIETGIEQVTEIPEIHDDINESKFDKNEVKFDSTDDGQTKRDSDWSEFDWSDTEQEILTGNSEDFERNNGNNELYENFGKDTEDDKSFQQDGHYDSDMYDDFKDREDGNLGLKQETDSSEIPDSFFKANEEDMQKETDKEFETELTDTDFEDQAEKIQKVVEANFESDIFDSYFDDKEEGIQKETDTELDTEFPESNVEDRDDVTQKVIDLETEIPDSYFEDEEEGKQEENDTKLETETHNSYFDDLQENDRFGEIPDLAEDVVESDRKTALVPEIKSKEMKLASCEVKLPSVCFSYEVEVMNKASTCENGWYGHVLLDTCYQILDNRMGYRAAVSECKARSARLVLADSEFERNFVLIAVQKDGKFFRGAKFWMESSYDKLNCKFFDERGVYTVKNCNTKLHVVCVKDAKSLSVYTMNNMPVYGEDVSKYYDDPGMQIAFVSKREDNKLPCKVTSSASEFPVLWFKDGVLVETKDQYVSTDIALYLNAELVSSIGMVTDRNLATPVLQGQYWCEVWDKQTLTRKRSKSFNIRFSDIISFHGSMELPAFSQKNELLFNMANQKFPELSAAELDIKKVFTDVLPMLQTRIPDVTEVFTYVDGVRSNPNVIEYHTYFTLNRDYTLQDEDFVYKRLKALLRTKLGNRYYMSGLPGHTPLSAFRTMSLQSTVSCPAATLQTTRDLYGRTIPVKVFSFPKAGLGEYANSIDNCSITNMLPSGTARCLGDFYTGAYWGEIVANECIEEADIDQFNNQIWGASPYTEKLTEIAQVTVDARNVEKLVSEVAQIAKVAPKFTPTDINKIADVLDHTTQVGNLPPKVGEDVLKTVDRLMAISEKEAHVANVETKAANRIIKSLERYAENADIGGKDQVRLVSDNVVVEIWNLKPTVKPVIGLAAESRGTSLEKPFKTESIATVYNKSQLYEANVDAAIELPTEVFSMKEKGASISERLCMMVFRKSKLFKAAITDDGRKMSPTDQQLSNLNSYVISASIVGKKLQGLNEKVKTIFKPIKNVESGRNCVWWDFDMNNFKGGWSSKGCVYDGKVNGRDVCLCDHLTNFAVLIDVYGQAKPIPDHHELSLSIITVLGLSCSILGLSLTIISYLFFRKLRQGRAQQTLFNLSLALLLSMLVFLVGVKQTHSYYGCVTVAVLLHYLILVSFMWMLMEAILQYLTFVKILGTYITRFTLKTVLPAWGLPLIPVIAVLCVDYTLYKGGPNYCWMGLSAFYYAFAIPVTCIIVINIIIFIVTIVSIFRRGKGLRSNQKKQKMAMTNLQAAITSFILLGLTWIFGYLAISDARLIFQYVFTILNSLQGFFIFILFVVRKKKVREQWYFICCKGIEKDRVSRSLSASNSIPSTYSNGSNRNSRKDGRERDRSDSTKTVQSTYSNSSNGFTNYGYDHGYDFPFSRYDRRAFRKF